MGESSPGGIGRSKRCSNIQRHCKFDERMGIEKIREKH